MVTFWTGKRGTNMDMVRIKKIYSIFGLSAIKYFLAYWMHIHIYVRYLSKRTICLRYKNRNLYIRLFSRDLDFVESILIGKKNRRHIYKGEYDINLNLEFIDTIIDCGANIGLFSVLYALNFPNKKIIAIEPEKDNYHLLRKNTKDLKNVECLQMAIWYRDSKVKVYPSRVRMEISNTYSEGAWYVGETDIKDKEGIQAIGVSTLVRKYNIGNFFMKMDIEGAEHEIFTCNNYSWLQGCKVMIIETHERFRLEYKIDNEVAQTLGQYGLYKIRTIGENKVYIKK